jgi:uncharacterized protein YeeX (DUF496 family)
MFELKLLTTVAVPKALERAERYRFLNEPGEAESICMDVLRVEPDNQKALVTLLLALTDQLEHGMDVTQAREVLARLRGDYEQAYYAGIICERRAKALMRHGGPGSGYVAYDGLREAMSWYEKAEALRPPGNDDATLRWNTCARILMSHPNLQAGPQERWEPPLE